MSFRPTAVLNGARRRILNSKEGPISFYKGTPRCSLCGSAPKILSTQAPAITQHWVSSVRDDMHLGGQGSSISSTKTSYGRLWCRRDWGQLL